MPLPRVLRQVALIAVVVAISACAVGCKRKRKNEAFSIEPPAVSWRAHLPAPAGNDVTALLGGLKAGDKLRGITVAAVGVIDKNGHIPIVFEKDGFATLILVSDKTKAPPPLVETEKYGVFYQKFDGMPIIPAAEVKPLLYEIAERLRQNESAISLPGVLRPMSSNEPPLLPPP
ncbi:MAG: hypothetical protein HY898_31765 [Deltaproteobacteria bacterium]|nr:hypothetical protein [Deltaproteobacteria bacterium]